MQSFKYKLNKFETSTIYSSEIVVYSQLYLQPQIHPVIHVSYDNKAPDYQGVEQLYTKSNKYHGVILVQIQQLASMH